MNKIIEYYNNIYNENGRLGQNCDNRHLTEKIVKSIVINEDSVITADDGIYAVLKGHNMNVLKIRQGHIELKGYEYGFIGGASVKLDEENILFFGDIKDLTDKNNVIEFCRKYNVNTLFIKDKKLKDIGSALIL